MLIQFTLRWAQVLPWANSLKLWVVKVRSYPSPKGLGELSCQQHVGNEKGKEEKEKKKKKEDDSRKDKVFLHIILTYYFLQFFPDGTILCLSKYLPYHHMAGVIQSFCINSWAGPDTSAFAVSSFPSLKDISFLSTLHWCEVCSIASRKPQFWLERNGGQDSCEGEEFAKLGKVDTRDLNFLKFWSGMLGKRGEVKAAFPKDVIEEGGLLFYAWCTQNNPQ